MKNQTMFTLGLSITPDNIMIAPDSINGHPTFDIDPLIDPDIRAIPLKSVTYNYDSMSEIRLFAHSDSRIMKVTDLWDVADVEAMNQTIIQYKHAQIIKPYNSDPSDMTFYLILTDKSDLETTGVIRNNIDKMREFMLSVIAYAMTMSDPKQRQRHIDQLKTKPWTVSSHV